MTENTPTMHNTMQWITAAVLAAFGGYIAAWYFGGIQGDFALLLLLATSVTGVYWIAERVYFWPQRRRSASALENQAAQRRAELQSQGIAQTDVEISQEHLAHVLRQPWWLDWTAGLFPVIALVFVLRSFIFEPFRIPTGSMIPTLLVGDFILVNKFTYGLRLPVVNKKITQGKALQRGDVVVFRYPPQPNLDYIKRVVGLPGDEVAYLNKRLTINGAAIPVAEAPDFLDKSMLRYFKQYQESLGAQAHHILNDSDMPAAVRDPASFPWREQCRYSIEGVRCTVPAGHYFMMGDNRDNSLDSRTWGFVPEENIVGKAFFVWFHWGQLGRVGAIR